MPCAAQRDDRHISRRRGTLRFGGGGERHHFVAMAVEDKHWFRDPRQRRAIVEPVGHDKAHQPRRHVDDAGEDAERHHAGNFVPRRHFERHRPAQRMAEQDAPRSLGEFGRAGQPRIAIGKQACFGRRAGIAAITAIGGDQDTAPANGQRLGLLRADELVVPVTMEIDHHIAARPGGRPGIPGQCQPVSGADGHGLRVGGGAKVIGVSPSASG